MLQFVVRRLLISIPLVLLSSFLVFVLVANSGDPLESLRINPRVSQATIHQRERDLHLDKPVIQRYGIWISDLAKGDLGKDNGQSPVSGQLYRAVLVTLRLVVVSIVLAVLIALIIGVIGALRQYSLFDYSTTFAAFLFFSLPVFWLAALLKLYGVRLNQWFGHRWVYTIGQQSADLHGGLLARLGDYAGHMVLPAFTLIVISMAQYSRFVRSSMLDVLSSDYVRTAEAKGLSRRRVVMRHALRNALIPVTTVVTLDFGAVIGGAVVTEAVFGWKGMGTLLITGVQQFDVNIVQAWLLVTAVMVVLFNLLADVIYAYLDPRIRLG
ncbi:MAG: glutathione transport system permease protein [Actinomycetota bacterium]|jgi:peptide/nickel transport system permease protein|nr:glutathione transport system permease protein [Actinomycetota bacterium]